MRIWISGLEAMLGSSTFDMKLAGSQCWKAEPEKHNGTFGVESETFDSMVRAALNE